MINIKELSIGNYVLHLGATKKVGEIISFTEIVLFQEKYYGLYSNRVSINEIEPVPLTPEILEKNGFEYVERDEIMNITHYYLGEEQFCKDMNLHIGSGYDGKYWLNYEDNTIAPIFYVHQLQNALTLCGINKEIEL